MLKAQPRQIPQVASGELSTHPPEHLVLYAHEKRVTGSLELGPPGASQVTVVFADGLVRKTRGVQPMYLGGILHELGFIDTNMLNTTLGEVARRRRPHGVILLERRAITRAQLAHALQEQSERRLGHLVSLPHTLPWRFHPGVDALECFGGNDWPDISPIAPIWRAIRETTGDSVMARALACVGDHPVRLKNSIDLSQFGFSEEELALALRLREPVRRAELETQGPRRKRLVERLLYCLLLARRLDVLEPGGAPAAPRRMTPPTSGELTIREHGQPIVQHSPSFSMRVPAPGHAASGGYKVAPTSGTQLRVNAGQPPAADSAGAEARREAIRLRAQTIAFEDHFHALGVSKDANASEVRATFFRLARIWHPDRLPTELDPVRDECVKVFTHLTTAYRTLTNDDERERYLVELEAKVAPGAPSSRGDVSGDPVADFRAAEAALAQGNRARAEALAQRAFAAHPENGNYAALVTWLEALRPENHNDLWTKRAIEKLDEIVEANPACATAYWYRGLLHKRASNVRLAIRDLRDVLSLQPDHSAAMGELRLYEMRIRNGSIPSGSMSQAAPKKHDSIGELVAGWLRKK